MIILNSKNYEVYKLDGDPERLIIVIPSLGYAAKDRYQQFYGLIRASGATGIFVADRKALWFQHDDTEEVFREVSNISQKYKHVCIIGDSMGGSGAILMSNYIPYAKAVIAFAPQFSVAPPFINFDLRYKSITEKLPVYFNNFSTVQNKSNCTLFYGNVVWQDKIHQSMFKACGFSTLTVNKAHHAVAHHLHSLPSKNGGGSVLQEIVNRLANVDAEYDRASWINVLGSDYIDNDLVTQEVDFDVKDLPPNSYTWPLCEIDSDSRDITEYATFDQSSISRWSAGSSTIEDAARILINDRLPYAFHTGKEHSAWWSAKFKKFVSISCISIENRSDSEACFHRFNRFAIETKGSNGKWEVQFIKTSQAPIEYSSMSMNWKPHFPIIASQVRIRLLGEGYLHLKNVKIWSDTEYTNYDTSPALME